MLTIALVMVPILLLAGLVVTFVAYPHRGRGVPQVPWLGAAMTKAVRRMPVIAEDERDRERVKNTR